MSLKFNALVKPSVLEDFNDEMNPLRILLQDHFSSVSDRPDDEAVQAIIRTNILRDYGEALTEGLRNHFYQKAGFRLTSLEFEGFNSSPTNDDCYCLNISLHKGDISLLDFYVLDEDIEIAIQNDIVNDKSGIYQNCPTDVSDWRLKSPEQRSPEERGMLINSASGYQWEQDIDFSELKKEIAKLEPVLNKPEKQLSSAENNFAIL